MNGDLRGKVALVTGGTSGIGLDIAHGLAAAGADTVINGLDDADANEEIRDEIASKYGTQIRYIRADMSRPGQIESMINSTRAELGPIDIVINSAGIQHVAPVEQFPVDKWDAILSINLSAAFHTSRLVLPEMRSKGWGRIVNIASAHALVASPFKSAYVAAKHGLAGLTKTISLETAEDGITVNAVCPGYVLTPLVSGQIPDTAKARGISEEAVVRDVLLGNQPTRKFVGLDELTAFTLFLCSNQGRSITGAILPIDGGWTAH